MREDIVIVVVFVHWLEPGEPDQLLIDHVHVSSVPLTVSQISGYGDILVTMVTR